MYAVPEDVEPEFAAVLAAGRAGVAPLLVSLELEFGARLLGPVLTEEVGTLFADGHWNRRLGGRYIRLESQANMQYLPAETAVRFLGDALQAQVNRDDEQRRRTRLAAQWFRDAQAEADSTSRYIAYWLVLEALELDENANIAPLKRAVADLLGVHMSRVSNRLGRLYGMRSKLVHGKMRAVEPEDIDAVKSLATALLQSHLLGQVHDEVRAALAAAMTG